MGQSAVPGRVDTHGGDAARAVALRDLIGQHGFTADDYRTITSLWSGVMGAAHPDDERDAILRLSA